MIKITNGKTILTVTSGAYRSLYEKQGWTPYEEGESSPAREEIPTGDTNEDEVTEEPEMDTETALEDESDDVEEEELTDDEELSDEELEETPLGELTYDEMKRLAAIKKLDVSGIKNKKELKAALKKLQ